MELDKLYYVGIVDVAKHCDKYKLEIAETNAFEYDLKEKLCDIWEKINDLGSDENEIWTGDDKTFGGVYKIWALFSYARYVENSIYVDTGSGFVRKDHSNSFPVQLSEVKDIARQHVKMAEVEITRLRRYLCGLKGFYLDSACHCDGHDCEKRQKATLFERRGRNVNRKDWSR